MHVKINFQRWGHTSRSWHRRWLNFSEAVAERRIEEHRMVEEGSRVEKGNLAEKDSLVEDNLEEEEGTHMHPLVDILINYFNKS